MKKNEAKSTAEKENEGNSYDRHQTTQEKINQKHAVADIAEIPNYENYKKYRCLVSQPKRYIATFLTLNIGMILFYVFSTSTQKHLPLLVLAIIFHLLSLAFMVVLAFADPGIIPKIYSEYEHENFKKIPIPPDYIDGTVSDMEPIFYTCTIKTHPLKVKFCNTCYIFRPPRTTHCYDCNMCV